MTHYAKWLGMQPSEIPTNRRTVIFDLDGTLIDSAPSILASMQAAFDEIGVQPIRPLTPDLVGPPLAQTLATVMHGRHMCRLPELISKFKQHYDEVGYRKTRVYDGVAAMLRGLHDGGLWLYIATNKRILPARNIVEHLGWCSLFEKIYALDYFYPALPSKPVMLKRVCAELGGGRIIYVGDRSEDALAAQESGIQFMWAAWGYGKFLDGFDVSKHPLDPIQMLKDLLNER